MKLLWSPLQPETPCSRALGAYLHLKGFSNELSPKSQIHFVHKKINRHFNTGHRVAKITVTKVSQSIRGQIWHPRLTFTIAIFRRGSIGLFYFISGYHALPEAAAMARRRSPAFARDTGVNFRRRVPWQPQDQPQRSAGQLTQLTSNDSAALWFVIQVGERKYKAKYVHTRRNRRHFLEGFLAQWITISPNFAPLFWS